MKHAILIIIIILVLLYIFPWVLLYFSGEVSAGSILTGGYIYWKEFFKTLFAGAPKELTMIIW